MAQASEKSEVRKIAMKDGREVEFAGKRKMLKDTVIEGEVVKVRFDFDSGDVLWVTVPSHLVLRAAGHGFEQKLGDSVAGMKDEETKEAASSEDMYLAIEELASRLTEANSTWNVNREGTGIGGQSILLRALIEHSGLDAEKVKAFLSKCTPAQKMAMRIDQSAKKIGKNGLTVPQTVEKLEAEKKAKAPKIDTDALMAEALGEPA